MSSFNKVLILGNLTRDPDMRTTPSGVSICKMTVATSRSSRNSKGESVEEVVFIDVDAFGKSAEIIGRYFTKGRPIFIEGRLRLDQWETPTGEKRSKICIVLESFQFIGNSRSEEGSVVSELTDFDSVRSSVGAENVSQIELKPASQLKSSPVDDFDDDVPF